MQTALGDSGSGAEDLRLIPLMYRFTGHEHDPETNDDYFGARYYSSTMGRFLTPDWSATPAAIPYGVLGNPQTLNLYSYVENNPITGTDPDGHYGCNGTVSGSPCPKDNQAPDIREDAKKAEEKKKEQEKRQAQIKDLKEKAAQNLQAIGAAATGIATRVGKLAIDEIRVIGPAVQNAAEKALWVEVIETVGPPLLVVMALDQKTAAGPGVDTTDGMAKKSSPEPQAAAAGGGFKRPRSGSGKEKATDVPSWAQGQRPRTTENGRQFAQRLLDAKYGTGKYKTGPGTEFNKIQKWGDRGFQ